VRDHHGFALGILDGVAIGIFDFVLDTMFVESLDRIRIGHAFERSDRRREFGVKGPDQGGRRWLGEKLVDGLADLRKEKCAIEITPKGL